MSLENINIYLFLVEFFLCQGMSTETSLSKSWFKKE